MNGLAPLTPLAAFEFAVDLKIPRSPRLVWLARLTKNFPVYFLCIFFVTSKKYNHLQLESQQTSSCFLNGLGMIQTHKSRNF